MRFNNLVPFRHKRRGVTQTMPNSPFERMHEEMDRMFEDFLPQFANMGEFERKFDFPASVDLSETADALELKADLPGLEESDIHVTLHEGALIISGERKQESEEKKKNYYCAERAYGVFNRSIPLPCDVEEEGITARFKKGVLSVHLPKSQKAKEKQRKIEIQAD